jgi:hypothetical protein
MATFTIRVGQVLAIVALALPALANAQGDKDRIVEAYGKCLISEISEAQQGTYTSLDGGRSAIKLMAQCDEVMWAYVDYCVATSSVGHTRGDCQLQAGMLAQSTLKMKEAGLR